MSNDVKNQHYIPQSILTNFANEKNQIIEALVDKGKSYPTNFRHSMSQRDTYEHPHLERNTLEKYFGEIESYFSPAMREIINLIKKYEQNTIEFDLVKKQVERYMSEYIIFYYRSGALLHEFSFEQLVKHRKIDLLLENIMNSKYIQQLSKTLINYYDFSVIKSEKNLFLLSDQYVSTAALSIKGRYINISNRHMGLKEVIILIPLSSKYYIVFSHGSPPAFIKPNQINQLTESQVKEINKVIINNSYKKCIGYSKQSLTEALNDFRYKSSAMTVAAFESGAKTGATLKKEIFYYEKDERLWDFLTNLEFIKFHNTSRNEQCPCGSGKKFKRCCQNNYDFTMKLISDMHSRHPSAIRVHPSAVIEKPIGEFFAYE